MKSTLDDVYKNWKQNIQAVWDNFGRDGVHTLRCWLTLGDDFCYYLLVFIYRSKLLTESHQQNKRADAWKNSPPLQVLFRW